MIFLSLDRAKNMLSLSWLMWRGGRREGVGGG